MKYVIISINELRKENKKRIRNTLKDWDETIGIQFAHRGNLEEMMDKYGRFPTWENPKVGELGVWYSNIAIWNYMVDQGIDELLVIEDDANLSIDFASISYLIMDNAPTDFDFVTLFVPPNQKQDYFYRVTKWSDDGWPVEIRGRNENKNSIFYIGNQFTAKVYQGYGAQCILYSIAGAERILDRVKQDGLATTLDCYLFSRGHIDLLKGYAPHPSVPDIVTHDFNAESTIQQTERWKV